MAQIVIWRRIIWKKNTENQITRSNEISQDLPRSHKIYWDLTGPTDLTKYIWHLIFELLLLTFDIWLWHAMTWHLTLDIYWDLTRSTEISQDLLRSHKIYWDLKRSIEISKDLLIWQFTFGIWHYWDLTRSTEISQDLLRSQQIYWDLTRSTHLN